jgi:trans-L-3-hydroxyproline dehydratase
MEGRIASCSFRNVPSFVLLQDEHIEVPGLGEIRFDVAFGGAFYALVDAGQLNLSLTASDHTRLIDAGRRIKQAVMSACEIVHPSEDDLSFLYGTIFTGSPEKPEHHSRNVCIFADGELDRSATGSGVSARAALHFARGEFKTGMDYTVESITGSVMKVSIVGQTIYGGHNAVIPEVTGSAYFTGSSEFWFDPDDPLKEGFLIR